MATADIKEADDEIDEHTKPPFLRRVRIRGYKSIAFCDVRLQPLTVLVGRNAAGKSNFLEGLAFLSDVVSKGVYEAVKFHGGGEAIHSHFLNDSRVVIEVECEYAGSWTEDSPRLVIGIGAWIASYRLEIDVAKASTPRLVGEHFRAQWGQDHARRTEYSLENGVVRWDGGSQVQRVNEWKNSDQVLLRHYGDSPLSQLCDALSSIETCNVDVGAVRTLQRPLVPAFLEKGGGNLASVMSTLELGDSTAVHRVKEYLMQIVPEIVDFKVARYGEYETIRFRIRPDDEGKPMEFDAASMSDGTLGALANIMAAFQCFPASQSRSAGGHPSLVGIEQPETALHPAALRALMDAFREATQNTQILITTHSPDLIDDRYLDPGQILVVRSRNGQTQIAPVGPAGREIVQKELYTLADLQRMDHLDPDEEILAEQAKNTNGQQEK